MEWLTIIREHGYLGLFLVRLIIVATLGLYLALSMKEAGWSRKIENQFALVLFLMSLGWVIDNGWSMVLLSSANSIPDMVAIDNRIPVSLVIYGLGIAAGLAFFRIVLGRSLWPAILAGLVVITIGLRWLIGSLSA